jgi:hypothetical protein
LKKEQLEPLLDVLGLPSSSRNDENAEKVLTFLLAPTDEGKPIPEEKPIPERKMSMRTTTKASTINSKESIPTDEDDKTEVKSMN